MKPICLITFGDYTVMNWLMLLGYRVDWLHWQSTGLDYVNLSFYKSVWLMEYFLRTKHDNLLPALIGADYVHSFCE